MSQMKFRPKDSAFSFVLAVSFFLLGAVCTYAWNRSTPSSGVPNAARPIQLPREGLVHPLLGYTVPEDQAELQSLHRTLQLKINDAIRSGFASDVGVYFRDLDSARWTGVNPDKKFSPASLLKVPLLITYLKLVETEPALLNTTVLYDGSFDDNTREDIQPLKSIQAGRSYTVEDLLKYMVGYSDNNATRLLADHILHDEIAKIYTDLSLPVPTSTADFMSPRGYSLFFRVLYNTTYLNKDMSQKALELLTYPDFPQGIAAGVPENVTVAQKFGEHDFPNGVKELHDCGIVYHTAHPYFLCVMTKGDDFTKLASVVRDVSSLVYTAIDRDLL